MRPALFEILSLVFDLLVFAKNSPKYKSRSHPYLGTSSSIVVRISIHCPKFLSKYSIWKITIPSIIRMRSLEKYAINCLCNLCHFEKTFKLRYNDIHATHIYVWILMDSLQSLQWSNQFKILYFLPTPPPPPPPQQQQQQQ